MLLDEQAAATPRAPAAERSSTIYRQATDLMKLDLLPKAYNLTLDNGATVRQDVRERSTPRC